MSQTSQADALLKRPNVVFVLTDDQGYPEMGCHGNTLIKTPHMDAMYNEGTSFDQFHVGPTCAPTRAGLLTGHHANSTGVWHTIGGRSLLRKNEWTLANALSEANFKTGLFGKWHLGDTWPYRAMDRGFHETVCHGGGGITQSLDWWGNDYFDDTYYVNGEPEKFNGYCTDVFFDEAIRFMEENKSSPFFCMIAPNAPHSPFNVPKKYQEMYADSGEPETYQRFMGMVTNIDDNLGKLRNYLEENDLVENTILIYMSDNGTTGEAWEGREDPYRAGMRGEKGSEFDGGHRAPFFLHYPAGGYHEHNQVNQLTTYVDVMPTILELCQVPLPAAHEVDGVSLVSAMQNEHEDFWEERITVTDSQRVPSPIKWKQSAVMKNSWRLINGSQLYNVATDPGQQNDVAAENPVLVEELRAGYDRWWDKVSVQFEETVPFSIGEGEVCLNTHDWRNEDSSVAWHQGLIRKAKKCNGYWEVLVEEAGEYEFELRRWPREAGHKLQAGIKGDDIEWRKEECWEPWHYAYTGGESIAVKSAHLKITGHKTLVAPVDEYMDKVVFKTTLEQGETRVQSWLSDLEDYIIGAYYVYVKKI